MLKVWTEIHLHPLVKYGLHYARISRDSSTFSTFLWNSDVPDVIPIARRNVEKWNKVKFTPSGKGVTATELICAQPMFAR